MRLIGKFAIVSLMPGFLFGIARVEAQPQLVGPTYDVNGQAEGNGYTMSTDPQGWEWGAKAGGLDVIYTGLVMSDFVALYWGPACIWPGVAHAVQVSLDGAIDTPGEDLQFDPAASDLPGGIARWTGSTTMGVWDGNGFATRDVDLRLTIESPEADLVDASTVPGITGGCGVGAVASVDGDFTVHYLFEAKFIESDTWTPSLDFFDSQNTPSGVQALHSFDFGFWYRPKGDCDTNTTVDLLDFSTLALCMRGPGDTYTVQFCACADFDEDGDVDLSDFGSYQLALNSP